MATSMVDISPTGDGSLGELEDVIKMALKKTGSQTELDLCAYLSGQEGTLPPSKYLKLKDTDRKTLLNLIRERVLDSDPYRIPRKVQESPSLSLYAGKSLEECIKEAMTKMNVLKETALCKYIPCDEGYLHHFTFLKMKSSNPIQLRNLIKEHIFDRTPRLVPPKRRHRRQPRELIGNLPAEDNLENIKPSSQKIFERDHRNQKSFETGQPLLERKNTEDSQKSENSKIGQLLNMMGQLIQVLQYQDGTSKSFDKRQRVEFEGSSNVDKPPDRYIQVIQNQLIKKIRMKQVDEELWNMFVEIV
jgi:hypothetical protein